MKKRIDWKVLIVCLIIVYGVGYSGTLFTINEVNSSWYKSVKPSITPPNYVFPIVWNILFLLIGLSLYFSWARAKRKDKIKIGIIFAINLMLNGLWSVLYFRMKNVEGAFIDLIFIWITIIVMICTTWKINRKAAYLLVPYLLWVSFAGILNYLSLKL